MSPSPSGRNVHAPYRPLHGFGLIQVAFSLGVFIFLTVGCGKRGGNDGKTSIAGQNPAPVVAAAEHVDPPEQDNTIKPIEAEPPPVEQPAPVLEEDPLAGYDRALVTAVERSIDHFAGLYEVPYGRIERHTLAMVSRNIYGSSAQEEQKLMDMLNHYSSAGFIRYAQIDLEKEHQQRHADKIIKPVKFVFGKEYMVSITRKAHDNLVSEITTPHKIYIRAASSKVTKIIKDVEYSSPSLSVSEDYRLLVGTAEMRHNPGLHQLDQAPPPWIVKFRVILHVNPFTGVYSPLCADIGYPADSGWHTNRIPSQQYGSPYDLSTIVPPPEPVQEAEPSFSESLQAAQERLPRHVSPSGNYILRKVIATMRGREACELADRDGNNLWGAIMVGPMGEVHWGPDENAVAFHEGVGNSVDGAWVVRMDPPGLIKGLDDEFSALLNKMALEEMEPAAAGLSPDAGDLPDVIRTKIVGWEDANTLRLRVIAHYLPSDKILEMDALLDITKKGAQAIHFPALAVDTAEKADETKTQPPDEWKPLIASGLHDSESMEINLGSGLVSFGTSWMVRMGARQAVGRFEDVEWERAKIVEEVDGGAFKGAVLIEIPLKPNAEFHIKNWTPSP
jgi:hypothetical protein